MSLYKQEMSEFWWFQIWTTEGKRIRKSMGTDDRAKAAIIEQTFLMAYGKKTPVAKLHAMLDTVCGGPQSRNCAKCMNTALCL